MKTKQMVQFVILGTAMVLGLSGCFGCKMIVKQANPYLDPDPVTARAADGSADVAANKQWQVGKMGLADVWKRFPGTKRVTVAIVGSGIDYNHEDLRGNILINFSELDQRAPGGDVFSNDETDQDGNGFANDVVGYDFVENDGFAYDRLGLGTAVAGVIGAVHDNGKGIKGVAGKVSMIPVRYIDANGQANLPRLLQALTYVAVVKPDVGYIHLANINFSDKPAVKAAEIAGLRAILQKLAAADIPLVVSAGNTGSDLGKSREMVALIAQSPNVLIVTSSDENDARPFIANFGMNVVQIAAPGEGVYTTLPGNRYDYQSGTAIAAAQAAGAIALAKASFFGKYSSAELVRVLTADGGDPIESMQYDTTSGARLNVSKYLSALAR